MAMTLKTLKIFINTNTKITFILIENAIIFTLNLYQYRYFAFLYVAMCPKSTFYPRTDCIPIAIGFVNRAREHKYTNILISK